MSVKTFSDSALGIESDSQRRGAVPPPPGVVRSFHLELRPKVGFPEFFAWQLYQRAKHYYGESICDGYPEKLVLLFSVGIAIIWGQNLQEITRQIGVEKSMSVVEDDEGTRKKTFDENERISDAALRKAIVERVKAEPDFDDVCKALLEPKGDEDGI